MKYIFRGKTILEYDPNTKQVETPTDENGITQFNMCKFIPEDYALLAEFFDTCYAHTTDIPNTKLEDIEVY